MAQGSGQGTNEQRDAGSLQKTLACVFYKQDPVRHPNCLRCSLRRIKDVKQHITRNHLASITTQQRDLLALREDGRSTDEEQWYSVWDKVFPGQPMPRSPYIYSIFEEYKEMLRGFMAEFGDDILSGVLLNRGLPNDERDLGILLQELIEAVLERMTTWVKGGEKYCLTQKT